MSKKLIYLFILFFSTCFIVRAQAPTATIVLPTNTMCTNVAYTFTASTTGSITAYAWSVTPSFGVEFVSDNASNTVQIKFSSASIYSLSLFVANSSGTFVTGNLFSINKSAKASYYAVLSNSGFPANLNLSDFSINANAITWDFGSVAPTQTVANVSQTYSTSGNYTVDLIAYGQNGCNDTLAYDFVIDDFSEVKLPNVFTPNKDGVNDVFKPVTKGLSELKVWVYNRFGNVMYSWEGVNGFWDGYTTSGIECTEGVYFYVLEAKGFDGKEYKLKSNLTLIK